MLLIRHLVASIALAAALPAAAFETNATAAYVYDVTTDTVLLEKNADEPLPPASMSKLMTLNMLFEALEDGRVDMDTRFGVSTRAREMGGSTMFLNERDRPTVEELIQGIVVMSGNDAVVAVAEGLAGSEEAFSQQMTQRARDLGMMNSNFTNASGWPDPDHRMSMRDLGILTTRLIEDFPQYYGYFAQEEFAFDNRAPANRFNRNPLLNLGIGADGLKTGHTSEARYGIAGSAAQGERRIVFMITGLDSAEARADEAERIVNWAFRHFVQRTIVEEGSAVVSVDVWMGNAPTVDLVTASGQSMLIPATEQDQVEAVATFVEPLPAPIRKGEKMGTLTIGIEGMPDSEVPLVAASDVAEGGFTPRLKVAASVLLGRAMNSMSSDPVPETEVETQVK